MRGFLNCQDELSTAAGAAASPLMTLAGPSHPGWRWR